LLQLLGAAVGPSSLLRVVSVQKKRLVLLQNATASHMQLLRADRTYGHALLAMVHRLTQLQLLVTSCLHHHFCCTCHRNTAASSSPAASWCFASCAIL
jgi:exopolysaccharide biosynthesis predicted pyruvyltransferase EpsI